MAASPSQIPVSNLRRSASLRVRGERPIIVYSTSPFPPISENEDRKYSPMHTPTRKFWRSRSHASEINFRDDDVESVDSCASRTSNRSTCLCEHSLFAKNGTTFSGRTMKYVEHCSGQYCKTPDEYLTPTQRANIYVKRLKKWLQEANQTILQKDQEITKLTQEVAELRVYKTSYPLDDSQEDGVKASPRGKSPWELRESMTATPDFFLSSLADSGQYDVDDLASSAISIQSKDSLSLPQALADVAEEASAQEKKDELVSMYEGLLRSSKDQHETEIQALKKTHEENVLQIVEAFERKLRNAEYEFEEQSHDLLTKVESEKSAIIAKLTDELEKTRLEFCTKQSTRQDECQTDDLDYDEFSKKIEEDKAKYDKAIEEMADQYQLSLRDIEKTFDDKMESERQKMEEMVADIQKVYDEKYRNLVTQGADVQRRFDELSEVNQKSLAKISQLEEENAQLQKKMADEEGRHKELYLKMFLKGQEALRFESGDASVDSTHIQDGGPSKKAEIVPVPELLVQLKVTEVELENLKDKEYRAQHSHEEGVSQISAKEALSLWMLAARKAMYKRLSETQQKQTVPAPSPPPSAGQDPQATLQFLKSSFYYFLTDRENHMRHLRAIENILGFSSNERKDIDARYAH